MIQELNKLQLLKQYKKVNVVFVKDEDNNYIENLQMLIFLPEYEKPVYATKLNCFETVEVTKYRRERKWANIPFICDCIPFKVTKIKLKDKEFGKLRKFLSQFRFSTQSYLYDEISLAISRVDGKDFTNKPVKQPKPRKRITA